MKTGNATRDRLQLLKDNDMANPEVDTYYKGRRGRAVGLMTLPEQEDFVHLKLMRTG